MLSSERTGEQPCCQHTREFKNQRRQLQGKRHIKIELCAKLSFLRLFHAESTIVHENC